MAPNPTADIDPSDNFDVLGPTYLRNPDWGNSSHRAAIAASLVNAVYVMEMDRQRGSRNANKWWAFFQFELKETLIDKHDGSVFGAVFEWRGKDVRPSRAASPPRAVLAFRGTQLRVRNVMRDLYLDLKVFTNSLHSSCRYANGLECLRTSVGRHGADRVWVAGHSLGAAFGLLAGRTMAEQGAKLEAHLFNPPFVSVEKEMAARWGSDALELKLLQMMGHIISGMAALFEGNTDSYSRFLAIRDWVPNLYVNSADIFCRGYILYFQSLHEPNRKALSRSWHVIPSANLILNRGNGDHTTGTSAHCIRQWWKSNLTVENLTFVRSRTLIP